jgi:glycosyltransferase involved in cell wall biosynthesis
MHVIDNHPVVFRELKNRALYCVDAIEKLKNYGVEHYKSVSRNQIAMEMAEAQVLAYPCAPVTWTEGYSNVIVESCTAGAVPVISDTDALGQIYGGAAITIHDIRNNLDKFTDEVVKVLQDEEYRETVKAKCQRLATGYYWSNLARNLDGVLNCMLHLIKK